MNAMRPLDMNRGVSSPFGPSMNGFGAAEPSAETIQMSAFRLPEARSVVVRVNNTRRPSGESCGSPTRTAVSRSATAIGRLDCAPATVVSEIARVQPTSAKIEM